MRLSSVVPLCFASLLFWGTASPQSPPSVTVRIENKVDRSAGINGRLQLFMSTSFQLAEWSYQWLSQTPRATTALDALHPQHTRIQLVSRGIPLAGPGFWDFSEPDDMLAKVQGVGDHSPQVQIGTAPPYMSDSQGHILRSYYSDFADMSADLVRYYNAGGFDAAGTHFQSPTPYPITWWGVFNEPNINGLEPQDYVDLYNQVVLRMAAVDPSIKFVAVELSDWGSEPQRYLPTFLANVIGRIDVMATHFYSSCNQADLDQALFDSVRGFADHIRYFYSQLAAKPALSGVPVWVTENNVNADYDAGNGTSACNGTPFVLDRRGTSPFFAAWRSMVFSQFGKAGAQALHHWAFGSDAQFGEVDDSATPYLSYWVDYYLSNWFPSPPGQDILQLTSSDNATSDTLAARNLDGSVVVLVSNHAVLSPYTDNNGPGVTRTFALDLSALGSFSSATLVTLDAATPRTGPVPTQLTPSAQIQVTINGYGAALLRLANAYPAQPAAGIVNAASYAAGPVVPGEIVSLFGAAIGPAVPAWLQFTNPRLIANSLEGVRVLFDGVPAPILYASAAQVNTVVPYSVAGKASTTVQVSYLSVLSPPVTLPVAETAVGVFSHDASGQGPGAILNAADDTLNSATNPVAPGDWVSIFATGGGATTPASTDGLLAGEPLPRLNAPVSVSIGGLTCEINYTGAAPGLVPGLTQINARVPAGVTPGSAVPVTVKIGKTVSQAGIMMAVR